MCYFILKVVTYDISFACCVSPAPGVIPRISF